MLYELTNMWSLENVDSRKQKVEQCLLEIGDNQFSYKVDKFWGSNPIEEGHVNLIIIIITQCVHKIMK